jgi:hypothetical protein
MPAYSFKEQFIPSIKSGKKRQIIRKKRKGQAKPGDMLYLYYGMRTKWCTKIGEAVCTATEEIEIKADGVIKIGGKKLKMWDKRILAEDDGFKDFDAMMSFWNQTHELPFVGDIIYWNELKN